MTRESVDEKRCIRLKWRLHAPSAAASDKTSTVQMISAITHGLTWLVTDTRGADSVPPGETDGVKTEDDGTGRLAAEDISGIMEELEDSWTGGVSELP